jgi:hypothetical protein
VISITQISAGIEKRCHPGFGNNCALAWLASAGEVDAREVDKLIIGSGFAH